MKLSLAALVLVFPTLLFPASSNAQMAPAAGAMAGTKYKEGPPSTSLRVTGFEDRTRTLTPAEFKALPHTSVTVTNGHSHKEESYSGVLVKDLLALVAAPKTASTKVEVKPGPSPRVTVVIAEGTDKFRVAITLCDTDPGCRSGQAIVADGMDGKPLTTDGAFKLVLTEDKMPGRWVRNLDALTEQVVSTM